MAALTDDLVVKRQREIGGGLAQQRFDFQTYWGATRILTLFERNEDFGIAFEFHDDIMEISPASQPTSLKCFQIKTKKSGHWTIKSLLEKKKSQSIATKLAMNGIKFADYFGGGYLVSNARFKFAPSVNTKLVHLPEKERAQFLDHFKSELGAESLKIAEKLEFWSDAPSLEYFEKIFIGDLSGFIERQLGDIATNLNAIARILLEHCRVRSKRDASEIDNFAQLISCKFITKSDVQKWLNAVEKSAKHRPKLSEAFLSCPIKYHGWLRNEWTTYDLRRHDVEDLAVERLRICARKVIEAENADGGSLSIGEHAFGMLPALEREIGDLANQLDQSFCFVALVYEQMSGN